ncbi:MAG: hybrid sensor histidine kinase/response regulator [Nitrospira sp.]|nr:hybrid sensor histidine kinase/response regulator [Nitrospira sp.]
MIELLSRDHTILERPYMVYCPFGIDENGKKVQDVSGISVRAMVTFLEQYVTQRDGGAAGTEAVSKACELLNSRVLDVAYHVNPKFLRNVWNSYSYEFTMYLREFCEQITGDPEFHFKIGQEGYLLSPLMILLRPLTISQMFAMLPRILPKFSTQFIVETISSSASGGIVKIRFTDRVLEEFGPYRMRCTWMVCQGLKGAMTNTPVRVHGMPPLTLYEKSCMGNGDEACEIDASWAPEPTRNWVWPMVSALIGLFLFIGIRHRYPMVTSTEAILVSLLPFGMWALGFATQKRLYSVILEQHETEYGRQEELREAYMEQQQTSMELRRKVIELTELRDELQTLNLGLESRVQSRTAELQAVNAKLIEMDQVKSRFIAHVSHELRTPLTSMTGFTENMLDGITGSLNDKQTHSLKRIAANAGHLGRMIDNLLDQASIEAGKIRLSLMEVSLSAVIVEAVDQMRPLLEEKHHIMNARIDDDVTAWVDPDKISQIVTNLVSNAIKYTREGGCIGIRLLRTNEYATVVISDTGEGIPAELVPCLFDPFFRVNRSEKNIVKGLGLGLSIVKQLVELHGGHIDVQSTPHQGTEFRFTVPLIQAPAVIGVPQNVTRRTILVVDDDADIRQMLSDRLEASGYDVLSARDGAEALDVLALRSIHGMILDIGMPGLDGLDVLARIRANHAYLPIVMITAAASEGRASAAMLAGAQAYLLKPLNGSQFQQAVDQWFGATVGNT